jgi:hypothetical protein
MKQLTRRFRPSGRRPAAMTAHRVTRSGLARSGALPVAVLVAVALSVRVVEYHFADQSAERPDWLCCELQRR